MNDHSKDVFSLLLALVLALGFALRLLHPTLVEFKRDEATVVLWGQAIAHEGARPAVGVDSSQGIKNLPLTLYLMALPLRLWPDPLSAVLFTCLLNALALPAGYLLVRRACDRHTALLATLLFAVSPWAVLYARKIWSRTLPLFTLAFMAALFAAVVWEHRWAWFWACLALAALLGLQLEGLAFVPLFALVLLFNLRRVAWQPLLLGAAVSALLLLPYGLYDARSGWANLRGLLNYSQGGGQFSLDAVRYAAALLGSAGIAGQAGPFHEQFRQQLAPWWGLNTLMAACLALALLYALYQAVRATDAARRRTFSLLSLWAVLPVLLQLRPASAPQPHYMVLLYPVQFVLVAVLAVECARWLHRHLSPRTWHTLVGAAVACLLLWSGWQVAVTLNLRRYMQVHPATGGYGIPLRYRREAAHAARELAGEGEVVVLAESTQPMLTEVPTVFAALLFEHPHRFVDARGALLFPEKLPAAYLADVALEPEAPLVAYLRSLEGVQTGPVVPLADGGAYRTYRAGAAARAGAVAGWQPLAEGIPFANQVVFAATSFPPTVSAGDEPLSELEVWLAWWLWGPAGEEDYHFSVQLQEAQLQDAAGAVRSQQDNAAFPSHYWRAGDLVLSRFVLPLPALPEGRYLLRASMYTFPDVAPVPVVDPQGQPVEAAVTLGEVQVE